MLFPMNIAILFVFSSQKQVKTNDDYDRLKQKNLNSKFATIKKFNDYFNEKLQLENHWLNRLKNTIKFREIDDNLINSDITIRHVLNILAFLTDLFLEIFILLSNFREQFFFLIFFFQISMNIISIFDNEFIYSIQDIIFIFTMLLITNCYKFRSAKLIYRTQILYLLNIMILKYVLFIRKDLRIEICIFISFIFSIEMIISLIDQNSLFLFLAEVFIYILSINKKSAIYSISSIMFVIAFVLIYNNIFILISTILKYYMIVSNETRNVFFVVVSVLFIVELSLALLKKYEYVEMKLILCCEIILFALAMNKKGGIIFATTIAFLSILIWVYMSFYAYNYNSYQNNSKVKIIFVVCSLSVQYLFFIGSFFY